MARDLTDKDIEEIKKTIDDLKATCTDLLVLGGLFSFSAIFAVYGPKLIETNLAKYTLVSGLILSTSFVTYNCYLSSKKYYRYFFK